MNRFIPLLVAATVAAAPAREEVSKEFSRNLTLRPGQRVSVENKNGDIAIRGVAGNEASIRAFIRVSAADRTVAEQFANGIAVDVTTGAAELRVHVRYPERSQSGGLFEWIFGGPNLGYSVRLELLLPEASPLQVRNAFGRIEVDEMKGGSAIVNSNGDAIVRKGRGTHRVETQFGRVQIARVAGDVTVGNNNGDVAVSDVTGNVTARSKFGAMEIERVSGTVDAQNGNQSVTAVDIGGRTMIATSFGAVSVMRVKADLEVRNDNGAVEVSGIAGSADITTKFGNVRFSNIGRSLLVRNSNGAVEGYKVGGGATVTSSFGGIQVAEVEGDVVMQNDNGAISLKAVTGAAQLRTKFGQIEVSGIRKAVIAMNDNGGIHITDAEADVTASTKFSPVKLERVSGAVTVTNDNGSISAMGLKRSGNKPCDPIRLSTKFGPIKVAVPEGGDYDLIASTKFGKIHSSVTIAMQGQMSLENMSGKIGRGGCELRLTNDNGGIDISASRN
jgi:hypothetical protein